MTERERFEAKVDRSPGLGPNGDCHEWTAGKHPCGYGNFQASGRMHKAHRVAWWYATGEWPPPDLCVLHRCDNPACVNIDHLWLGTRADNNADMAAKGRHVGRRHLTRAQVNEIRGLQGVELQRATAERFGVRQATVSRIQSGKRWANG